MRRGALAFGGGCAGEGDAACVGGGPVERLDGGGVVDGDDCGNTCLPECVKAATGIGLAICRSEIGGCVVVEDGDLALEVEIGWRHAVADEDERGFDM